MSLNPVAPDRATCSTRLDALRRYPDAAVATRVLPVRSGWTPTGSCSPTAARRPSPWWPPSSAAGAGAGVLPPSEGRRRHRGGGPTRTTRAAAWRPVTTRRCVGRGVLRLWPPGRWTRGDAPWWSGSLTKLFACPGLRSATCWRPRRRARRPLSGAPAAVVGQRPGAAPPCPICWRVSTWRLGGTDPGAARRAGRVLAARARAPGLRRQLGPSRRAGLRGRLAPQGWSCATVRISGCRA